MILDRIAAVAKFFQSGRSSHEGQRTIYFCQGQLSRQGCLATVLFCRSLCCILPVHTPSHQQNIFRILECNGCIVVEAFIQPSWLIGWIGARNFSPSKSPRKYCILQWSSSEAFVMLTQEPIHFSPYTQSGTDPGIPTPPSHDFLPVRILLFSPSFSYPGMRRRRHGPALQNKTPASSDRIPERFRVTEIGNSRVFDDRIQI